MNKARFFYHSFPRPKGAERDSETLERGLKILAYMKEVGLVLAPEVVQWDASALSTSAEKVTILQRRACFTELRHDELSIHSRTFGPISLEFEIADLRASGAVPVIYSPQGLPDNIASQLATLVVRGAWHTEKVLQALNGLKSASDPNQAAAFLGLPSGTPVSPDCVLELKNPSPDGGMAAEYQIPAAYVRQLLDHVSYRSIPFDHSAAILRLVMNMFYPTDNDYTGAELGYYRQREWRLVDSSIAFDGHPMTRPLNQSEQQRLCGIDPQFWERQIEWGDGTGKRIDLALVYQPKKEWSFLGLAKAVVLPEPAIEQARAILGPDAPLRAANS